MQTQFGDPDDDVKGNCFAACVASILEIPLEDVPDFAGRESWFLDADRFAREHGYTLLLFEVDKCRGKYTFYGDCYYIGSGKSPRGDWTHAVVCRGTKVVHDPHPSGEGIVNELTDFTVFAAVNSTSRKKSRMKVEKRLLDKLIIMQDKLTQLCDDMRREMSLSHMTHLSRVILALENGNEPMSAREISEWAMIDAGAARVVLYGNVKLFEKHNTRPVTWSTRRKV